MKVKPKSIQFKFHIKLLGPNRKKLAILLMVLTNLMNPEISKYEKYSIFTDRYEQLNFLGINPYCI